MEARDDPRTLVVSPRNLRSQLDWLLRRGYRFLTADDLVSNGPPRRGDAVLTFDDGWLNGLTEVTPMLLDLGIRATFFVCPGWFGRKHPLVKGPASELMSAPHVRELIDNGMEVGSHAMTHPDLRRLSPLKLAQELHRSKDIIEQTVGRECRTFAYPFGAFERREKEAVAEAGYRLAFAWTPGRWDPYAVPRLPGPPRHGARRLALKMFGIRRYWRYR